MALRDREISLSYFHEIPHSVQFIPQQNKTSNYHSPVEVAKFLKIRQQDFTSSTRHSPYKRVYFYKIPHSIQFNPQQNKASNYQSPVEVVQFLKIPQAGFFK